MVYAILKDLIESNICVDAATNIVQSMNEDSLEEFFQACIYLKERAQGTLYFSRRKAGLARIYTETIDAIVNRVLSQVKEDKLAQSLKATWELIR